MTFYASGQVDVRKQLINAELKGFAEALYKMKQVVTIATTGAWRNDYFRESPSVLTAGRSRSVKGIPRGAAFPQVTETWEKVRTDIEKYGAESSIAYEDIISGEVNVRDRTLFRVAEAVTYSVDSQIYAGLSGDSSIQSFTIAGGVGGKTWDASSAAIMDDLEYAEQLIGTYNYDTSNLFVLVNLRDKRSVMAYLLAKGAQIPQITNDKVGNGIVGKLGNKTFVVSPVVATSTALVVAAKVCATWKELMPLTSDVQTEPLKDVRIRAAEYGVLQVTDPKSIVKINNTLSA